jgi:hypothetical protein
MQSGMASVAENVTARTDDCIPAQGCIEDQSGLPQTGEEEHAD